MKLKTPSDIIIIDIICIILVLLIVFVQSTVARVILGLPFLLFFPGYALINALFVNKGGVDNIEQIVLSFGMSIAITALIGFGLNYSSWGIRLEPIVFSITCFIFVMSGVALFRKARLLRVNIFTTEFTLRLPNLRGGILSKSLSIVLVIAIFGAFATLAYTLAEPKIGEKFNEFYILGIDRKAEDYPTLYILNNGNVTQVIYDDGTVDAISGFGKVILGIVNQRQQTEVCYVQMTINDQSANIEFGGTITNILGPIELQQGEQWENEIGIIPDHIGNSQEVELFLYSNTETTAEDSLHFWINVKQAE